MFFKKDKYLIWSNEHAAWWGHNSRGYTADIDQAGRYTRREAMDISRRARLNWTPGTNPPEIALPERDALEQSMKREPGSWK